MTGRRLTTMIAALVILISGGLAMSVFGQADRAEVKATAVIQYKIVQVPEVMTQAQLQSVLTAQGNAGYRLILPFAVGTGPIPNQSVLVFSKP
jgi:hypothetical protein